ncbi:CAP domain-containing protein [Flagellimonas taeanensis]|uniref:CAP domain-containing protein n=1 Tax=Flavobacteriaceae TaxID=49546 RepID=UPI000E6A7B28|nr:MULTISPECIES: CAP domain-containing protein [Allomuricauda]MDC6385258.1 CAP domain-containing protein [Muricauda sp. SK9]RIV52665.1 CAP domain-containing protein [Allomuricauda taeanensis]
MKKIYVALMAMALLFVFGQCSTTSPEEEEKYTEAQLGNEKVTIDPVALEDEIVDMVNQHRNSIGLNPLQDNPASYKYAEEHNDYMISKNRLSHDNFESRASKIAEESHAVGVSENVARYYTSAKLTVDAWLESTSHKEALEGDYTHTTLSIQLDKEGRPYFTQIFIKVE